MAKFCGKCGSRLDEQTGKCPSCDKINISFIPPVQEDKSEVKEADISTEKQDTKTESKTAEKKEVKSELPPKQKKPKKSKKMVALLSVVFILFVVVVGVCSFLLLRKTPEEIYATKIVDAFEENDFKTINNIIFHQGVYQYYEDIGLEFNNESEDSAMSNGILASIFSKTELTYKGVEDNQFVYEIVAPNVRNIFDENKEFETQEQLQEYICEYIQNAKNKEYKIYVDFKEENGRYSADYQSEEFLNAITGGLMEAYQDILNQYMEDIISGEVVNDEKNN